MIVVAILYAAVVVNAVGQVIGDGFEKVAENEYLSLYYREASAEVALRDRRSEAIWYSNPQSRTADARANDLNLSRMSSQVVVELYTPRDQRLILDSYSDAVAKRRVTSTPIAFGVRVSYGLTNYERGVNDIPRAIEAERFRSRFLAQMTDEEQAEFLDRFRLDADAGYYYSRGIPQFRIATFLQILDRIGYTEEELAFDGQTGALFDETREEALQDRIPGLWLDSRRQDETVEIVVPVEYRLDGPDFVVHVDTAAIEYDPDYPISAITLLDYFGAAGTDARGYMLVPDGSGALIHLNNGKSNYLEYSQSVYGDQEMESQRELVRDAQPALVPVYGLMTEGRAWFAVIEEGDAIATIHADVSGRTTSYNHASATFRVMEKGRVTIGAGAQSSSKLVFEDSMYPYGVQIRYAFLSGADASYVGMADWYRRYLQSDGTLPQGAASAEPTFELQLIGAIDVQRSFAGVAIRSVRPTTTTEQALEIVDRLQRAGVAPVAVRYSGWLENGLHHVFPEHASVEPSVAHGMTFHEFAGELADRNVGLYPDVHVAEVYESGHGFSPRRDAVRHLNQSVARRYTYDVATFQRELDAPSWYYLSPDRFLSLVDPIVGLLNTNDVGSISIPDIAVDLRANYRSDRSMNRTDAELASRALLEGLDAALDGLAVAGGNGYSWRWVDHIFELPSRSSEFNIADESVPFVPMVLRGLRTFSYAPLNLAVDYRDTWLRSVESGADIAFVWTGAPTSVFKETRFDEYVATGVDAWFDRAVSLYSEHGRVQDALRGAVLIDHRRVADGVYRSEYDTGAVLVVNYGREPITVDSTTIGAQDFVFFDPEVKR